MNPVVGAIVATNAAIALNARGGDMPAWAATLLLVVTGAAVVAVIAIFIWAIRNR